MRPDLIEYYLITLHTGGWFEWTDIHNRVYSNLRLTDKIWDSSYQGTIHEEGMIDNPYSLPTEQECIDGLKALQDTWDLENDSYKSKRRAEYPSIEDQLDDIYHNGIDGWKSTIKATKDKYSKG
tara:strand:+ start:166 stop:537 length:372 start_codon:yes stop_codon:yes gene_type:complete